MPIPDANPEDYQFEKLMELAEAGRSGELYARLLRKGPAIFAPLANFLIRQPNEARSAVLIDLLGKLGDERAVPLLMRFLDIPVPELKMAAATALGWLQAPAALEKLDEVEGGDRDPAVRQEARAAIEQILARFPNLAHLLRHHSCPPSPGHEGKPGELEFALVRAVPRLVAFDFKVVPLAIPGDGTIRLAARTGAAEESLDPLRAIIGLKLDVTHWTSDRIHDAQERLYTLGDDDFCDFAGELRPQVRRELARIILDGVRPDEPICPLDEAQDAVDAVQAFLSLCCSTPETRAIIEYREGRSFSIRYVPGAQEQRLQAPPPPLWKPFLTAFHVGCGIEPTPPSRTELAQVALLDGKHALSVELSGGQGPHSRRIEVVRTL